MLISKQIIENIKGLFHTQTEDMPKISTEGERPSYTTLRLFQDAFNKNARSIPSHQSHNLGHLGIAIRDTDYLKINRNIAWSDPTEAPTKPSKPTTPAGEVTDPFKAAEAIRAWTEKRDIYMRFVLTQDALRNQIIANVEDQYINHLHNDLTEYSTVTPKELLDHLWSTYGDIDETDRTKNEARMKAPWSPPSPVEELFKQLREGQKFAQKGNETIGDELLARYAYENINATGIFSKACTKWRKKAAADKTWTKCQKFFTLEITDAIKNSTAEQMYTAAQVQEILDQEAKAIEDEQNTEPPPASSNAAMTEENIAKIVAEAVKAATSKTGGNKTRNNNRNKEPLVCQGHNADGKAITYCWTHGITTNLRHNSKTCKRRAEGHKAEATLSDKMGGSEATCTRRSE